MGLAASQARALLLVARKSDLEYRAQCITQRKMVLAMQQEQLATNYSNAISNRKLKLAYNIDDNKTIDINLSYEQLTAENAAFVGNFRVTNSRGDIVVASIDEIPGVKNQVPIYAEKEGESYKIKVNESYNAYGDGTKLGVPTATGGSVYPELYMAYQDANNKTQYVKVQGTDGKPVTTAQVGVKDSSTGAIVMQNVFAQTDPSDNNSWAMIDNFKGQTLFTKSVSNSYSIVENPADGQNVGIIGYETKYLPRAMSSDGYYYSDDGRRYVVCPDVNKERYFQSALRNGSLLIEQAKANSITHDDNSVTTEYTYESRPWQGIEMIKDELYTEDDALAESVYEAKSLAISCQDKKLDLELKQIETQHKAIEAEEESVKKVIDNNIKNTFKIFAQG